MLQKNLIRNPSKSIITSYFGKFLQKNCCYKSPQSVMIHQVLIYNLLISSSFKPPKLLFISSKDIEFPVIQPEGCLTGKT